MLHENFVKLHHKQMLFVSRLHIASSLIPSLANDNRWLISCGSLSRSEYHLFKTDVVIDAPNIPHPVVLLHLCSLWVF